MIRNCILVIQPDFSGRIDYKNALLEMDNGNHEAAGIVSEIAIIAQFWQAANRTRPL